MKLIAAIEGEQSDKVLIVRSTDQEFMGLAWAQHGLTTHEYELIRAATGHHENDGGGKKEATAS